VQNNLTVSDPIKIINEMMLKNTEFRWKPNEENHMHQVEQKSISGESLSLETVES
jgi:hypothetical protein